MISITSARTAAERRAVAEFATEKSFSQALETTPSPQAMCPVTANRRVQPLGWTALERLGCEHLQHTPAGWRHGRLHGGPGASPETQVGVRLSRRRGRRRATHDCRTAGCSSAARAATYYSLQCRQRLTTGSFIAARSCRAAVTIVRIDTRSDVAAMRPSLVIAPPTCTRLTWRTASCSGRRGWTIA